MKMTNPYSVKRQILASQIAYKRSLNNEQRLERDLSRFFAKLKKEVLTSLDKYWKDYQMLQGHMDLILSPVHEAQKEYYDILSLYVKKEYKLGRAEGKRLVKNATRKHKTSHKSMQMPVHAIIKRDNDLFATLPSAEERLLNRTFRASERTMARVDSQISSILTDGYRSGKGIDSISNELTRRFDQLTTWESKRIARTEVHNAHNVAVMDTYEEVGVEYTMWIAAEDERTRDSHLEINGEIIPMGGEYSNGLKYPGDTSGDIEEWINCRCSNAPFVMPYGFMAPSFSPFREDDLIKVDTKPITPEPEPVETPVSPLENYTLETMQKDVPMSNEDFNKFLKWSEKRATKNKIEYGYQFDTKTGKLIGEEVKGKKGGVTFKQHGENIGSMHTHPPERDSVGGGAFPSKEDLKLYRGQDGADHLIGSPNEVWYVHAEEKLGISPFGVHFGQKEIDTVYSKVYDEVSAKGKQLVKQGKLKTDNESLRTFMNKEIGDGLLREFNTPEWQEKGFYLRRAYR